MEELRLWIENSEEERMEIKERVKGADNTAPLNNNYMFRYLDGKPYYRRLSKEMAKANLPFQVDSKIHIFVNDEFSRVLEFDKGKSDFDNDDFFKKIFIMYACKPNYKKKQKPKDLGMMTSLMNSIDKAETHFGKSIREANGNDLVAIFKIISFNLSQEIIIDIAKNFKQYLAFVNHKEENIELIGELDKEYITKDIESDIYKYLTKELLIDYMKTVSDIQYKIIPLLLFIGVGMGTKDTSKDEVRTMKKEDVLNNGIMIRGEYERFIDVDEEEFLYYISRAKNYVPLIDGVKSDFVYSPFLLNSQSNFGNLTKDFGLSHQGYRFRLKACMAEINELLGLDDIVTPKHIINAGMIYYANKFMYQGQTFDEATWSVVERFGKSHPVRDVVGGELFNIKKPFLKLWKEVYGDNY